MQHPFSTLRIQILTVSITLLASVLYADEADGFSWDNMESLRDSIVVPTFPDKDFPVTDFGAVADGKTDCKQAFKSAIEACSKAGGGRVTAKGGTLKTGPIHLRSNVNLHIADLPFPFAWPFFQEELREHPITSTSFFAIADDQSSPDNPQLGDCAAKKQIPISYYL